MPSKPSDDFEMLAQLRLKKRDWAELEKVASAYRVSRTAAVNRAIAWMVKERWVPGFTKKVEVNANG